MTVREQSNLSARETLPEDAADSPRLTALLATERAALTAVLAIEAPDEASVSLRVMTC